VSLLTRTASLASRALGRQSTIVNALRPSYEWALDAASGGRGVPWPVNGETLRIDPRARRVVASTTEPELWSWLKANVRPHDRILDVGSFLGVYAIFLARWAGPSARVLAFEPTPSTVTMLRRHVEINDMTARVTVMPVALGDAPGYVELHEHSDPYRNAIGADDPLGRTTRTRRVELTTLDAVCRREGFEPTLLRMDVQGFERAVLGGAREVISAGKGKLRIVLEVHPQLWPLQGFDAAAFDATLREVGLRPRPLREGGPLYEPDGHVALDYV
jgi:FkbM family methyltransferase